jgi:hypothetical protein
MAKKTDWIITTSGDRPIHDIAKDLTTAGFTLREILEEVGCITGSADEKVIQRLRKISGVTDISPDLEITLGPPDAGVTW